MEHLFTPVLFGMSWAELLAIVFSAASVLAANFRKKWQYPVGIIGTIIYYFVFVQYKLYASAGLQIFFTAVQVYGWWYWTRGDCGKEPKITSWSTPIIGLLLLSALIMGWVTSVVLTHNFPDFKLGLMDSMIFSLSVVAQFLLDRKKLESWIVWAMVNVLAIYVYGSQGLAATAILYAIFLANTVWGFTLWYKAKKEQDAVTATIVAV